MKMHVYAPSRAEYSACNYYRVEVPLRGLHKLGLAETFFDRGKHHYDKLVADQQAVQCLLSSDIDLFYAIAGPETGTVADTIKSMRPGKWPNGHIAYPPSMVYDIDDNLDWVHPFHTGYAVYGIRDSAGTLLEPTTDPEDPTTVTAVTQGKTVPLWVDGRTVGEKGWVFNVARNRAFMRDLHSFVQKLDGFTTPSAYLGKYLHENYGYPEPYVFPNSIIPEDYYWPNLAPHKGIRILWQGGASHFNDWYPLRSAIAFIAKKYPQVTFVIFGSVFPWITDIIPPAQLEIIPWQPYEAYKPMRAMLDCDINLCIVRDNDFSRSKSAIKFYEGSLGPRPEATLATDCLPYRGEMVDGEDGLLYKPDDCESFAANLSELIENPELRRTLADSANKKVLTTRHYEKTVPGLFEYYQSLRERKKKDCPYVPGEVAARVKAHKAPKTRAARKALKARKKK